LPYIPEVDRNRAATTPSTPGELNYAICMLLMGYVVRRGQSYTILNDCMGALTGAQLEFSRRVVTPYENLAIGRNGDVF
jgi:hypothetical protein